MSEPADSDPLMNSPQTTTEQGQGHDALAADFQFEKVRHDIGKYLLTELYRQPKPASSGHRRYLHPLWVFCNRDSYESELSHALSSASFSELIAPTVSDSLVIKEKIRTLLTLLVFRERHILVQFWAPITIGGQRLLSTSGQPFGLGTVDEGLCLYRMDSLHYKYTVDTDNDDNLSLPGRVFRKKLPEWTPNVGHYSVKDYPQKEFVLRCNIQGSLALPVFEPYGQHCVGVLELVMYHEYIDCTYEVQEVCRALKDVDLMSSISFDHPSLQVHRNFSTNIVGEGYQNKLDEIFKGLEAVCNTHSLPLAQTWTVSDCKSIVANNQSLEKSCSGFNQNCMGQICMSTASLPFYLSDAHMWQFRKACTEHHLRKGQGVVGMALSMYTLCLCNDLKVLKETEYPFVDLAIKYGLSSCFAICMEDVHASNYNYVTEFFLPPKIRDQRDILSLVESILITMKPHVQSFKVGSLDLVSTNNIILVLSNGRVEPIPFSENIKSPLVLKALTVGAEKPQIAPLDVQLMEEDDGVNNKGNTASADQSVSLISLLEKKSDTAVTFAEKKYDSDVISSEREDRRKIPYRKRRRNEKAVSKENIQQQFGKTIDEAAENLGVSRSTLKRICRQHDIDRWPNRKREKDNTSISKIKQTKESSRGTEGAFHPNLSSTTRSDLAYLTLEPTNIIRHDQPNSRLIFEDVLKNPNDLLLGEKPSESTKNFPSLSVGGLIPETNKTNHQLSDLPPRTLVRVADMAPPITTIQDVKTFNIKATYKDNIIKFPFSVSAGLVKLEEQVGSRLKLKHGSFVLKYQDGDGDWISITCGNDLYYASGNLESSGNTTIRLLVQLITN